MSTQNKSALDFSQIILNSQQFLLSGAFLDSLLNTLLTEFLQAKKLDFAQIKPIDELNSSFIGTFEQLEQSGEAKLPELATKQPIKQPTKQAKPSQEAELWQSFLTLGQAQALRAYSAEFKQILPSEFLGLSQADFKMQTDHNSASTLPQNLPQALPLNLNQSLQSLWIAPLAKAWALPPSNIGSEPLFGSEFMSKPQASSNLLAWPQALFQNLQNPQKTENLQTPENPLKAGFSSALAPSDVLFRQASFQQGPSFLNPQIAELLPYAKAQKSQAFSPDFSENPWQNNMPNNMPNNRNNNRPNNKANNMTTNQVPKQEQNQGFDFTQAPLQALLDMPLFCHSGVNQK